MGDSHLNGFLEHLAQRRRYSPRTIEAYGFAIRTYLGHFRDRGFAPEQASQATVLAYLKYREHEGLGPGGIHQAILALRHFYRFLGAADPTSGIPLPRLRPKLPEPLGRDEISRLLEQPKSSRFVHIRDKAILELLYATGLRISELLGLEIGQIDLDAGTLRVRGKGGRERLVPFGRRAVEALERFIAARKKRFPDVSGSLFLSGRGGPLRRTHFWRRLKDYARQAGITRRVSPHVLRHSFATHMLSGGADLRSLQAMLGHRRITTTEIYAHVEPEHLRRVWDRAHPLR